MSKARTQWKKQRNMVLIGALGLVAFVVLGVVTAFVNQSSTDVRSQAKSSSEATFKVAQWECYDGKLKKETRKNCRTHDDWQARADRYCKRRCSKETGECGVSSFVLTQQCSGGSASPTPQPGGCSDSDGGRKVYIAGRTSGPEWGTGDNVTKADYCISPDKKSSRLVEYYCRDKQVASKTYTCKYGCDSGRCLNKNEKPSPTPAPSLYPSSTPAPSVFPSATPVPTPYTSPI